MTLYTPFSYTPKNNNAIHARQSRKSGIVRSRLDLHNHVPPVQGPPEQVRKGGGALAVAGLPLLEGLGHPLLYLFDAVFVL